MLLDIARTAVEYPHQCLFIETLNLVLDRLNIGDIIALRQLEIWNSGARRCVIEE